MKKNKKSVISLCAAIIMILVQSMPVFAAEPQNNQLVNTDISTDTSTMVAVKEVTRSPEVTDLGETNPISSRIQLPGMLIYSITVNAYGIDRTTGTLYYFPNVYITCNANSLPSNSLVANCDASYTRDVVRVLDNVGCDFCGWEETIEYGINTYLIPKMLESRINGVTQPIIRLSSSDKQHIGIYEFGFLIADIYQPYEGIVDGNLVCANLDGSAAYIPFMAGFRFNVQ